MGPLTDRVAECDSATERFSESTESNMSTVAYPHISTTDDGVPMIAGTEIKVVEVVLDRLAHHWDADEIQRQHPHLSLAQIYAALAYYHDHKDALDRDIAARLNKVDQIASCQPDSAVQTKLQATKELS
jgi:uncharacterized protein (DUF433 family)